MPVTAKQKSKMLSTAWVLALGGFIPFFTLAVVLTVLGTGQELFPTLFDIFKTWSAVILSFLGGIRWGFAIANEPDENTNLVLSVILPVLGWASLLLPDAYTILTLLILFCIHGAWDSFYINTGKVVPWFGKVRITLTFLVVGTHIAVLLALSGGIPVLLEHL